MDRRRNNGSEVSVRPLWPPGTDPTLLEPHIDAANTVGHVLSDDGTRLDGRYADETRPLALRLGVVPAAPGSAYAEQGHTRVVATVYGPRAGIGASRSVGGRMAWASRGQMSAEIVWAPCATPGRRGTHAPGPEEYDAAAALLQALAPAVRTESFPGAYVDIYVTVFARDGGDLALAITAASAALVSAGVEMADSVVGVSLASVRRVGDRSPATLLVDPTGIEAGERVSTCVAPFEATAITAAVMPTRGGMLTQMLVSGPLTALDEAAALAVDAARAMYDSAVRPSFS